MTKAYRRLEERMPKDSKDTERKLQLTLVEVLHKHRMVAVGSEKQPRFGKEW